MNTSMKIYLVIHKFCNEDYDGNPMLGEEIITSFSTKETAERFVLKWSNPHSLPKPYDGIYLGELYIKELTLDSVNIDEDPHIGKDLEDYYCRNYDDEEEAETAPSNDEHADEKKICTLRVAEHYRCQGIATKLLKIAHQALQCTNPLITVSSIHINEFEFLLKKNGFTLYKKYENYYKQGIVEYAFNGLLPEKQNDCRLSQNVV